MRPLPLYHPAAWSRMVTGLEISDRLFLRPKDFPR